MSIEEREYYMKPSTLQHIVFVMCDNQYLYTKWLSMLLDIIVIHLINTAQINLEIGEPFMNKFNDCFNYTNGYLLVGILIQNKYLLNIDITRMIECFHFAYDLLTTNKAIYFKYIWDYILDITNDPNIINVCLMKEIFNNQSKKTQPYFDIFFPDCY